MTPTPEEPPQGEPDDEGPDSSPDEIDAHPRGWIDPDDRLWRHPSEVAGALPGAGGAAKAAGTAGTAQLAPPSGIHRYHSPAMVIVGAAALLAAVAWTVILLSPASDHPPSATPGGSSSDPPLTTLAGQVYAIPSAADQASQSMVQLRADTSHGVSTMVGVAVAEGGLVATTADGLSGLRSIAMIGADGRPLRASVVAIDHDSDLALVDVPDDVPVAPFADDGALTNGSADMMLSMVAPTTTSMELRCTPGSVTAVATPILSGPADGMPAIASTAPGVAEEAGDPLLDPSGAVIGILYRDGGATPTYLPTQLVLGVADDLRSSGRVAHGWLGVDGSDAAATGGAKVSSIVAGSPAAGLLHAGEVITEIGTFPVRSMAELRARLYVLAPQTTVALSVLDGATLHVVDVTLSGSP